MCVITEAPFDPKFEPTGSNINFILGLIIGSFEEHPGNEYEFAVYQGSLFRRLPSPDRNLDALMDAGYILEITEQYDGRTTLALTEDAEKWCEERGIIPATTWEDRRTNDEWVERLSYVGKTRRAPGQRRKGVKPTPKTTSQVVRQMSYTPEEAAGAHADIAEMFEKGYITERTAAGYKATVTRRIQMPVAA